MIDLQLLENKVQEYLSHFNKKRLTKAFEFAKQAHSGQKRKTGEDYFNHPFNTALILTEIHADEDTLIAALLHDVPEDTTYSLNDIEKLFSKDIAYLVRGITKLSKVYYRHDMHERQIESLKKLLIHSAKDVRVILIKLADRLDNMRTLYAHENVNKRIRIARETLEIYAPIANLFGLYEFKREMEDLCFEYLFNSKYLSLKSALEDKQEFFHQILNSSIQKLEKFLNGRNIKFSIEGRIKNLYSIFKKMEEKNKSLMDIEDLVALRIIVETPEDCYRTLGLIHEIFKPKTTRFKDYIAVPKPNGYQSLHTVVFSANGIPIELQIRTQKMNIEATYGFASHYFYEEKVLQDKSPMSRSKFQEKNWAKKILLLQREMKDNRDFMKNLQSDIFQDRIFVFTPKGDVIDLPLGACCIDFAYAIHTDIGNSSEEALINNKKVALNQILENGDVIRIITNKENAGPQREWLTFAKTQLARNKIKDKLRQESTEKKKKLGIKFLEKELKKTGKNLYEILNNRHIKILLAELNFETFDDLLAAVGEGNLEPQVILDKIYSQKFHSYEEILGSALKKDTRGRYKVELKIFCKDRIGLLKSLLVPIEDMGINILNLNLKLNLSSHSVICNVSIMIKDFDQLSKVYESIEQIPEVMSIERLVPKRIFWVMGIGTLFVIFWSILPYGIAKIFSQQQRFDLIFWFFSIFGILMIFLSIFYLYQLCRIYFADLVYTKFRKYFIPLLTLIASIILVVELKFLNLPDFFASLYGLINFLFTMAGIHFLGRRIEIFD